ncbi:hypothetical protein [Pontimicrobium aquaticum]|uniref:Four helix bundle sensory module for signal transduction n=1 Tax=Pontimicrobium aquaticum TaxID=2565367 RepID=A0A4U0F5G2_9FLAO|nr:hypothetical protein [Pontimicrobium aquaticum]TJY38072.1 hypothetical protein E5167_02100 [Pontimicrobium aquaticum]
MNISLKKTLKRLYKSTWFVTLFATTMGVLLAFYLNDVSIRTKINQKKAVSIKSLALELKNNENTLVSSNDNKKLTNFLQELKKINGKISRVIEISTSERKKLEKKYHQLFNVVDSIKTNKDLYQYNVEYSFNLELNDLSDIAWETYKLSEVINEFDYECIQAFVGAYKLQEIYLNEQQKLLNYFVNANHSKLLGELLIIQQLKSQLINTIKQSQKQLMICN